MPQNQTAPAAASPALKILPAKRPEDTSTPWEDPWAAATVAREALESQAGRSYLPPGTPTVGHRITEEIDADPSEVRRLKRARTNARAGRLYPRHSDTKSS